jgi:hypothetical protein
MTTATSTPPATRSWPTLAVLALLWAAIVASQLWVFGILFLIWAAWDITTGESHFLQRIHRQYNPVTFWAVELAWIGFGLLWILYPS